MKNTISSFLFSIILMMAIPAFGQSWECGVDSPEHTTPADPSYALTVDSLMIPLVVHVVYDEDGTGNIADWQVQAQVDTLNASFTESGTRFRFFLAAVNRIQNKNWHEQSGSPSGNPSIRNMTDSLAINTYNTLNIYVSGRSNGYGTMPDTDSLETRNHGIFLNFDEVPGGAASNNSGKIGVHEVGHYLGLHHTFNGNTCNPKSPGDYVDDTPQHLLNGIGGCPDPNPNTCPSLPGIDPIHNHMNWNNDTCRNEFTPGQSDRMDAMMGQYRPGLGSKPYLEIDHDQEFLAGSEYTFYTDLKIHQFKTLKMNSGVSVTFENNSEFIVDGKLEADSNVTVDMSAGIFTVNGDAVIGSGFTLKDGIVDIGSSGSMDLEGSALFEFIEIPVMPPFFYHSARMDIRGTFTSTIPPNNITMRLSNNSTFSEWEGITVFSSSDSTKLWGLTIEDAKTGIHLSGVDDAHLWHVTIDSPSQAGLVSMSSNTSAAGVNIINSGGIGVDISGGNPDIGYFDADSNSESGVRSANYATTFMPEGSVSGTGAGAYAGVWVENASHEHVNGTIGSVAGWQAAAVNNAWALFNGTTWAGGTPYTHVDGSSDLYILNPNNPQKAPGGGGSLQAELLQEWSERYREDRSEAVSWLSGSRSSMPAELQAVASALLADHHLATGQYEQAGHLLSEASADRHGDHLAPGALAQRQVLLAVHGPVNEELGRSSMEQLWQTEADARHLALLEGLMERRYGPAPQQPGQDELLAKTEPQQAELGNYPNPFNPVTSITYTLPQRGHTTLEVFDMTGRRVALLVDQEMPAGSHSVPFDGSSLASGVYFYRLSAGSIVITNTLTLIK